MDEKIFPKVLIINSQSILADNATGITMRSLWEEWPKDRLMEIYENARVGNVSGYSINSRQIARNSMPIKKIMFGHVGEKVNKSIKSKPNSITEKKDIKRILRQSCIYIVNMSSIRIQKSIEEDIDRFSPDIIYTLGGSVAIMELIYKIAKKKSTPIVIHFMDNWVESLQENDLLISKFYKLRLSRSLRKCLKFSKIGIAISDSMAQRYKNELHMDFSVLMNSVDIRKIHKDDTPLWGKGNSIIRFVYAGGLHLDRWKALLDIATVLQNKNAELCIYSSSDTKEKYEELFSDLPVRFYPSVPHDRIWEVYDNADVLVHVETNNPAMLGFFKYSISTKIPEYLATKKLVLFYGPSEMGLFEYLKENDVAICASNYQELDSSIDDIVHGEVDAQIMERAYRLAERNHNKKHAQEILYQTIIASLR